MKISQPTLVRRDLVALRACLPLLAGIVLLTGLGGCKRDEQATPRPQPAVHNAPPAFSGAVGAPAITAASVPDTPEKQRQRAWMRAIFGDAYAPARDEALFQLDMEGAMEYHQMTLVSATTLPDGRVAVVVNGKPSDEKGNDLTDHGAPGVLNVYVLRPGENGWQVSERRENLSSMGSWGRIGEVDWIDLGAGRPGFIVKSGGTWQGNSIDFADVFELSSPIRELGNLMRGSSNEGACHPGIECWTVASTIRFAEAADAGTPADMLVDFTGKYYHVTEGKDKESIEHVDSTVQQTARYRFDGQAYVLAEGVNPVPEI
jgi:hypothetical protein